MTDKQNDFRGISRLIYESICNVNPDFANNGQINDIHMLDELEAELREKMVKRADGSSRLVIDLALGRAMREVRRHLNSRCLNALTLLNNENLLHPEARS